MKKLMSLLIISVFIVSSFAISVFASGPTSIRGSLGDAVIQSTLAANEDRFRQSCYFTSQGAICPTLTPSFNTQIQTQRTAPIESLPGRATTASPRVTIYDPYEPRTAVRRVETDPEARLSARQKVVTRITGRPGSFSRWSRSKRNVKNICYIAAAGTQKGNLVCGNPGVTDIGQHYKSFRASFERDPTLTRVGKEELTENKPERLDYGDVYTPYRLTN